ncbi:unnamed protein product, partial [Mesorhabditis spiculigera]
MEAAEADDFMPGSTSHEPVELTEEDREKLAKQEPATDFKKRKLEIEAQANWDRFYHRNQANFFKDRNWSPGDMAKLCGELNTEDSILYLEAGCGVGNMLFPIAEAYSHWRFQAFDFSKNAVKLLEERAKEKMPGGLLFIRDYGANDHAMVRFGRGAKLDERFYARQDGTRAYYFFTEELQAIFSGLFECQKTEYLHRSYLDILYTDTNLIFDRRFYSYVLPAVKSMGEPYTLRIKFTFKIYLFNGEDLENKVQGWTIEFQQKNNYTIFFKDGFLVEERTPLWSAETEKSTFFKVPPDNHEELVTKEFYIDVQKSKLQIRVGDSLSVQTCIQMSYDTRHNRRWAIRRGHPQCTAVISEHSDNFRVGDHLQDPKPENMVHIKANTWGSEEYSETALVGSLHLAICITVIMVIAAIYFTILVSSSEIVDFNAIGLMQRERQRAMHREQDFLDASRRAERRRQHMA